MCELHFWYVGFVWMAQFWWASLVIVQNINPSLMHRPEETIPISVELFLLKYICINNKPEK